MIGTNCERGAVPLSFLCVGFIRSLPVFQVVACDNCGKPIIERNFLIDIDTGEKDGPYCDDCAGVEVIGQRRH